MSAPAEGWTRLEHPEGNPIDADPDGVKAMGDDWRAISEAIGRLHDTAQRTQDSQDMQSDAFDETKKKGAELAEKLADYETRYDLASQAARTFSTQLDTEIDKAETAARKAAQLDKLDETTTEKGSDEAVPTSDAEDQKAQLEQYKRELEEAVEDAQSAADAMESSINEAKKSGKDSCMDKFKAFLKKLLKVLMIIGMILSVIGLLIPGLNVIMIMGLIVDVVTMVFTTISFALGQSTVLDLVLGIVGVGLGAFSAFRSLKGLKVDAEREGYVKGLNVRNGSKPGTGGHLRRPIEMPSWSRDPKAARRDAADSAWGQRSRSHDDLTRLRATRDRLNRRMDELRNEPLPSVSDPRAVERMARNERAKGHVDAQRDRVYDEIGTAQSKVRGADEFMDSLRSSSSSSNAAKYFFTKDWMRLDHFAGRTGWVLGVGRKPGEEIMSQVGGVTKKYPTSFKDTLWHGFLDRMSFRESRGFLRDSEKFRDSIGNAPLRISDDLGDLNFKSDGRILREPLSTVDGGSKGVLLGGHTDRVGWSFGNHDYLMGLNGLDSIRKTWGYIDRFGQMWEYGDPSNYFDPAGEKTRLTPWSDWKAQHPGNPNYSA